MVNALTAAASADVAFRYQHPSRADGFGHDPLIVGVYQGDIAGLRFKDYLLDVAAVRDINDHIAAVDAMYVGDGSHGVFAGRAIGR